MGSDVELGMGRNREEKNSARLIFRQNKAHPTKPNMKGPFESGSLLTQLSWSSVCTVDGLAWNTVFVLPCAATAQQFRDPRQLLCPWQFYNHPSVQSVTPSLVLFLVSFLGLSSLLRYHTIAYTHIPRVCKEQDSPVTGESGQVRTVRLYRVVISQLQSQQTQERNAAPQQLVF